MVNNSVNRQSNHSSNNSSNSVDKDDKNNKKIDNDNNNDKYKSCKGCILCRYERYNKCLNKKHNIKRSRVYSNRNSSKKSRHLEVYRSSRKISNGTKHELWKEKHGDKGCIKSIGTRIEVMHGLCERTQGGLRKEDLKYNPTGKIVSIRASENSKRNQNLGIFIKKAIIPNCFIKSPKIGTPEYEEYIKLDKEFKEKKKLEMKEVNGERQKKLEKEKKEKAEKVEQMKKKRAEDNKIKEEEKIKMKEEKIKMKEEKIKMKEEKKKKNKKIILGENNIKNIYEKEI